MAKWVSKNKVKQVVINPFFYFEFDHIPSNDEIKQEIQDFIDTKNVNYSIKVSYHEEQKGNFGMQRHSNFINGMNCKNLQRQERITN